MQAALKRGRTSVDEPNEDGLTPLHLASIWPDGLSLLLAHGADHDKTNPMRQKPVELAIFHGCVEGVQLLLKAGCRFDHYRDQNIFKYAVYLYLHRNWRGSTRTSQNEYFQILKILIRELALRQGEVISSMLDVPILTRSKVSMSDNGQHFKSGAAHSGTSYPSLREGTPRLQSILPGMRTVYHLPGLTVKIANELWNAGFRDVDVPDKRYRTPLLMMLRSGIAVRKYNSIFEVIDAAFWLFQKGASLHRPSCATLPPDPKDVGDTMSRSEKRVIHFVVGAVKPCLVNEALTVIRGAQVNSPSRKVSAPKGGYPAALEHLIDDLNLDGRQFLREVLLDESPDGCLCACSGRGCMPMTYLLKRRPSFWMEKDDETLFSAWIRRWFFENVPTEHLSTVSSQEILRLTTFEALGLRHTCCEYVHNKLHTVDPEEAAEIRDEDDEGIQLLESLLSEFEEKRGVENIKSFIDGYWSTRIEEVLAARDEEPVDRAAMREVGVLDDDDGTSDLGVETE